MSEKYIRKNKSSYMIVKNSKNYGKFNSIDVAKFIRDKLICNDWNLESIRETYQFEDDYLIIKIIDGKLQCLGKFKQLPAHETIEKLYMKHLRNPNDSKYGLNISKIFDTFIIKKRIAGDDYIFGYYDCLDDAEFVRNHLLENSWNVNSFSQIQYCDETDDYRVIEVIDDKVYVLNTFKSKSDIDIDECHSEFLAKITKHKLGLAQHSNLHELTDKVEELEARFNVKAQDDVWSFKNTENPLNDVIFNLTPFQKSVYDAVNDSTFDEIKKSLIRFKSGNFDEKIRKNLDELVEMGLISKNEDNHKYNVK